MSCIYNIHLNMMIISINNISHNIIRCISSLPFLTILTLSHPPSHFSPGSETPNTPGGRANEGESWQLSENDLLPPAMMSVPSSHSHSYCHCHCYDYYDYHILLLLFLILYIFLVMNLFCFFRLLIIFILVIFHIFFHRHYLPQLNITVFCQFECQYYVQGLQERPVKIWDATVG